MPTSKPLKGFVRGPVEHGALPGRRTTEGFDPNAYKLLAKAGYNFSGLNPVGSLLKECDEGAAAQSSNFRPGLGYQQKPPVRITLKSRKQAVDTCTITVRVTKEQEGHTPPTSSDSVLARIDGSDVEPTSQGEIASKPHRSVFDRLDFNQGRKTKKAKDVGPSVSNCIGRPNLRSQKSVFKRLGNQSTKRASVFQRLGGRLPSTTSGQLKSHHKTHNSIPAQEAILEVNISEEVMKGHKIIIRASGDEHNKVTPKDEASCSSYHITVSEETKSDQTVDEVEDAPPALEDGGQATIEELKEINLGTKDDP